MEYTFFISGAVFGAILVHWTRQIFYQKEDVLLSYFFVLLLLNLLAIIFKIVFPS